VAVIETRRIDNDAGLAEKRMQDGIVSEMLERPSLARVGLWNIFHLDVLKTGSSRYQFNPVKKTVG
jgi:hypothetical protein